jgi:hypothetical protein
MSNGTQNITHAYCVELERVVDIYEAHFFYFDQERVKRFRFLCSDDLCRATGTPVIGVKYDNPVYGKAMFFRRHGTHKHIQECKWNVPVSERKVKRKDSGIIKSIPMNELFDEFVINEGLATVTGGSNGSSHTQSPSANYSGSGTWQDSRRNVTTSFARLASVFMRLDWEERKILNIKIGARTQSLYEWFWPVSKYLARVKSERINYGVAKVNNQVEQSRFVIEFTKPVASYDWQHKDISACAHISYSECENKAGGTALRRALLKASEAREFVTCFTLGTAKLNNENTESPFLEVIPRSLKCIVLMDTAWSSRK